MNQTGSSKRPSRIESGGSESNQSKTLQPAVEVDIDALAQPATPFLPRSRLQTALTDGSAAYTPSFYRAAPARRGFPNS